MSLDAWSTAVLWQVCHAGPYRSSVRLAIDLDDVGQLHTRADDGVLIVELALRELNVEGLVVYSTTDLENLPLTRVRATQRGFDFVGLPHPVRIVGPGHSLGGHDSDHPGDGTDWRNQPGTAPGGRIERAPLREHVLEYLEHAHLHWRQLVELGELDMVNGCYNVSASDGTRRTGPKIKDPDQRAARDQEIRRLAFDEDLSQAQLARRFDLSESAIGTILGTISAKSQILEFLEEHPADSFSIRDLSSVLKMDINKAQYTVDSLRKRKLVEAKAASGSATNGHHAFGDIKLRKRPVKGHSGPVTKSSPTHVEDPRSVEYGGPVGDEEVTYFESPPLAEGKGYPTVVERPAPLDVVDDRIEQQRRAERGLPATISARHAPETPHFPYGEALVHEDPSIVESPALAALVAHDEAPIPLEETLAPSEAVRYPLLERLLERDSKIAEAARLLESVGLDDLAIAALQKQDDFTPLEREYVRFAVAQKGGAS